MFDVARVRGLYVSLGDGWVYLNSHERGQVPERVNAAAGSAFRTSHLCAEVESTSGTHSRTQPPGTTIGQGYIASARRAVADLVGASADRVVLGPNRAVLLKMLAESLRHRVGIGSQLILARTSDSVNIAPWERASHLYGGTVKWAEADLSTGALPVWQFESLVSQATSLVAIPAAHSLVGSQTDVAAITSIVHEHSSAWVLVDATALLGYSHVDINRWQADVIALDLAPLGGPELGALVFRDRGMFDRLLNVSGDSAASGAEVLELGGVQPSLCGAVPALVDHWAGLDESASGSRKRRLETTLPQVEAYLSALTTHLLHGLHAFGRVHVVGIDGEHYGDTDGPVERIPRVSFIISGVDAATVQRRLAANGVIVGLTMPGQDALFDAMGVSESGGAVTVGLAPFNSAHDVDSLLRAVASLV